jgi:ethanolamine utilization protein EutN
MELGKVIGQVVSTVRAAHLPPGSLLLVEPCGSAPSPPGAYQVAIDMIGAGIGEWVLLTRGSSARKGFSDEAPVDLCIIGIVDEVTEATRAVYSKSAHND